MLEVSYVKEQKEYLEWFYGLYSKIEQMIIDKFMVW